MGRENDMLKVVEKRQLMLYKHAERLNDNESVRMGPAGTKEEREAPGEVGEMT